MANKVLDYSPKRKDPSSTTETYKDVNMISIGNLQRYFNVSNMHFNIGKLVDVDAVKNAVHNIFTWIPGERILDPEFGNKVRTYLYEGITEFSSEQIIAEINHAVQKYEPRATIDSVQRIDNTDDNENNTVGLNIIWHATGLPERKYTEIILI